MKSIIRKAYWNYEKEEQWLNEMASRGLALTDYSWCRYVFEDSNPGEYIYRIELLDNIYSHPASQSYLRFMEESGVEHVASYMRWVYFRKKTSDGAFDIYSDVDSKIKHYQKINLLWTVLACSQLAVGVSNITIGCLAWDGLFSANLTLGCIISVIGLMFLAIGHPLRKKIRKLKNERVVRE